MRSSILLCLAAGTCLTAQVKFTPEDVAINVDGKPFTVFHLGEKNNKPFLAPLRSASGKIVTRGFPMENIPGESRDHLHHTGLWFSYDDVNGVKFWENDPSYTKPNIGRIVVVHTETKDGDKSGILTATMEWRDPAGKVLLVENRDMTFYSDPKLRIIDFHITLTAAQEVTIGDTKEGVFAVRLTSALEEPRPDAPAEPKRTGKMVDSEGRQGEKEIWGKRADWADFAGVVDGEPLGIAIFDNPSNPRHPTWWHARGYGLFAANIFGLHDFEHNNSTKGSLTLAPAKVLRFRYRVLIHSGDASSANIAQLYRDYAGKELH